MKGNKAGYGTVTKEVMSYYHAWLSYSNLTENALLEYSKLREFNVVRDFWGGGVLSVSMMSGSMVIGVPFVSPSVEQNEKFLVDVSLLLLYIAERLDKANRDDPPEGFIVANEYFYQNVRDFLKRENSVMI